MSTGKNRKIYREQIRGTNQINESNHLSIGFGFHGKYSLHSKQVWVEILKFPVPLNDNSEINNRKMVSRIAIVRGSMQLFSTLHVKFDNSRYRASRIV